MPWWLPTIDDGIQIVDITDPANIFPYRQAGGRRQPPDWTAYRTWPSTTIGDRHYAVVTSLNEHGIQVVDVTNPYNPVPKATIRRHYDA